MKRITTHQLELLTRLTAAGVLLLDEPFQVRPFNVTKRVSSFETDLIPVSGGYAVVAFLQIIASERVTLAHWHLRGKWLDPQSWHLPRCAKHPDKHCFRGPGYGHISIAGSDVLNWNSFNPMRLKAGEGAEKSLVGFLPITSKLSDVETLQMEIGFEDQFQETHWFPISLAYHCFPGEKEASDCGPAKPVTERSKPTRLRPSDLYDPDEEAV